MIVFFAGIALIGSASAVAWVLRRRPFIADAAFSTLITLGCAAGFVAALRVLVRGEAVGFSWNMGAPTGIWALGIDSLAAVFLLVVFGVGLANVLYGVSYLAPERAHREIGGAHLLTGLFLAAMGLVVAARAMMPFLLAWELMALSAYLLVVFEDREAAARRAGLVYLAATHVGALALIAMFSLWGTSAGQFTFDGLADASVSSGTAGAVLCLALVGFGLKAGLVPLHFWLPGAHASAPSHVSGLMSGVMIKTGIYGLLRVIHLIGDVPAWWGWVVLMLGIGSGVLGVLWALSQHDLKRLLAYHSIENIGIILLGVGVGALGIAYSVPAVALLGFAGAVLHTVNHAVFKSLLFLGAGAVLRATGTRAIDRLGGLARRMPKTWLAFLIGSAAIVGLPPLNGFVSEWLIFQGLLRSGFEGHDGLRAAVLGVAALALIGGLALACFAKVGGVVFLGEPRSTAAEQARERTAGYVLPMGALALVCIVIGLLPALVMGPVFAVAGVVAHTPAQVLHPVLDSVVRGAWGISLVAATIIGLTAGGWAWRRALERRRSSAWSHTWACGYVGDRPAGSATRTQYTAASFAAPLLRTFGPAAGLHAERAPAAFHTHAIDLVLERVLVPAWRRVCMAADMIRPVQYGRLHNSLLYMVAVLLTLLVYLWLGA